MESRTRIAIVLLVVIVSLTLALFVFASFNSPPLPITLLLATATPTPRFTDAEVQAVAIILTYEAQVFPEPLRSQAYIAIAWTMRNRIEIGFSNTIRYTDDRVLSRYASYADHKNDVPDSRAVEIARQVLGAETNADDPTHGARNYVDRSYWTGTNEQIGALVRVRGKFSDIDVQRLVDDGDFALVIEWKAPTDHPRGLLFYGLYFFDGWPPPVPVVTPTFTPTPIPTLTRTRTPTRTVTPTITRVITATPTISGTVTITQVLSATATLSATIDLPIAH